MEQHIELEVALEVIMSQIADAIFELEKEQNDVNENRLKELIEIQEKAYKGDGETISKILKSSKA